ncbi:MAG: 50S ribosomal protein L22 [Rickettsiaceae bacterium H1]|nr:50S ribosomal protein L22 [Rickettsiaceae bacterium H1]
MIMAVNNRLKGSVQKVNLVADLIRGKKASVAITMLQFTRKYVALDIKKVLFSAIANAQNNHFVDVDNLFVSKVLVEKGKYLKRFRPRARGMSNKINKSYSKVKIFLSEVA